MLIGGAKTRVDDPHGGSARLMNDECSETSHSRTLLWVVVFAPVLYVLSVGPAVWVAQKMGGPVNVFLFKAYTPVIWLHHETSLKMPLEAYFALWGIR